MKDCIDWFLETAFFVIMFAVVISLVGCGRRTVVIRDSTVIEKNNCGWDYQMDCYACDYYFSDGSVASACQ